MADRRRRRRPLASESECSEADKERESECESEADYESVSEDVEEDDYTYTEDYSDGDSVLIETDSYYEDDSELFGERQSGDGEEQPNRQSEVDEDEDRKNPAYVPKKGSFYEHDSRSENNEENESDKPKENKKKLWLESTKWLHDRFDLSQQGPKSRDELVTLYGYDIRAHSEPPETVPFLNQNRGRRRSDKSRLSDYIDNGHFSDSRPRGAFHGSRGRGESRGRGRGRGRGMPDRAGPRTPPGPPPGRWVEDTRRSYSDYKDHRQERHEPESGSESFARDTSPNDPERGRRFLKTNSSDSEHVRRVPRSNPNQSGPGRRLQNNANQRGRDDIEVEQLRGKFNDAPSRNIPPRQYNRSSRSDVSRGSGDYVRQGQGAQQRQPGSRPHEKPSQDARFDGDYRDKRNFRQTRARISEQQDLNKNNSLENIMEIAPPLTTIETRTKVTVAMAEEDQTQRGYLQDRRANKARTRKWNCYLSRDEDSGQLGYTDTSHHLQLHTHDQISEESREFKRDQPEKPPRFREQEKQSQAGTLPGGQTGAGQITRDSRQTKRYSTQRQRNIESGTVESPPPVNVSVPPPGLPVQRMMMPASTRMPNVSTPRGHGNQAQPRMAQPAYYGETQGVYRQAPPVYRAMTQTVTQAVSGVLNQQQMMMTQQALALQNKAQATGPVGHVTMATARPSAQPPSLIGPQQTVTMATARPTAPPQQLMGAQQQYIAAPIVNMAPHQHYQISNQMQGPVAYPSSMPLVPQRSDVVTVSAVNPPSTVTPQGQFISVGQGQMPPPQGQIPGAAQLSQWQIPQNAMAAAGQPLPGQPLSAPGPGQPPAIHVRGGTTYFHPQIQPLTEGRSPARRAKEPIPIVDPKVNMQGEDDPELNQETQEYAENYVQDVEQPAVVEDQEQYFEQQEYSDQQYVQYAEGYETGTQQEYAEAVPNDFVEYSTENSAAVALQGHYSSEGATTVDNVGITYNEPIKHHTSREEYSTENDEVMRQNESSQENQPHESFDPSNPSFNELASATNEASVDKMRLSNENKRKVATDAIVEEDSDSEQFFEAESESRTHLENKNDTENKYDKFESERTTKFDGDSVVESEVIAENEGVAESEAVACEMSENLQTLTIADDKGKDMCQKYETEKDSVEETRSESTEIEVAPQSLECVDGKFSEKEKEVVDTNKVQNQPDMCVESGVETTRENVESVNKETRSEVAECEEAGTEATVCDCPGEQSTVRSEPTENSVGQTRTEACPESSRSTEGDETESRKDQTSR